MSQESILGPYLKPGTPIKVGAYSTKIVRYLSEGGFSHVYIARLDIPVRGTDIAVLKRIVAPDKAALAAIRTEVETMKKLKGHKHIVKYIDSHASALQVRGYEVYVLMEYCPGGGLIDFMNTRLQTRLAEWEVLKIISDTTEAVACMHYLRPPLLHRDLKIENVLISGDGDYKLCDFGSCTEPKPPATTSQERRLLEEDIQKNTTIQYRSPEMVDVSRRLPIDEKSDIWALGVLLYKLCYFTTPFEAQGQLAILNAAYTFPPYPPYTDRTKRLIAVTLQENPRDRPNVYQLLAEICSMRNVPIPIRDIYTKDRAIGLVSASRPNSRSSTAPQDNVLAYQTEESPELPPTESDVIPMRRGRPERKGSNGNELRERSQPIPMIAPLKAPETERMVTDETDFSSKFPSLEDIDIALETLPQGARPRKIDAVPDAEHNRPPSDPMPTARSSDETNVPHPSTQSRQLPPTPQSSSTIDTSRLSNHIPKNGERSQADNKSTERSGVYGTRDMPAPSKPASSNNQSKPSQNRPDALLTPKFPEPETAFRSEKRAQSKVVPDQDSIQQSEARPSMVSRASQTTPKERQAVNTQTQTSPLKNGASSQGRTYGLSSNLMRDSSGYIISRGSGRPEHPIEERKPQFKFTTSLDRQAPARQSSSADNLRGMSGLEARPKTVSEEKNSTSLSNDNGHDFDTIRKLKSFDAQEFRRSSERAPNQASYMRASSDMKRSLSVNSSRKNAHRPSLSHIPSFSGAAKNIMNSKFGEAFKKFESSGKTKPSPTIEHKNPLLVAEEDLPEHITQHLQTAQARRSSSYSRSQYASEIAQSLPADTKTLSNNSDTVESSSTSIKEAMKRLNEKATQAYVPQRSAQGYGKYTSPEVPQRAATTIPFAREDFISEAKKLQGTGGRSGPNTRRYELSEKLDDDDSSTFSKRYPSVSDFKV